MKTQNTPMSLSSILRARVKSAREDAEYARRRLAETRALKVTDFDPAAETILKLVKKFGLFVPYNPDLYKSTYSGVTHLTLSVEVNGLKDPIVAATLAAIDAIAPAQGSEDYVTEWSAKRTFEFTNNTLCVKVNLIIKDGSATCHKVQTGTELREVPKYALVCD